MTNHSDDELHPTIQTKCPACGWKSLFIGSGGYLTCGNQDCSEPVFDDALQAYIEQEVRKGRIDEVANCKIAHMDMHHGDKGEFDRWCTKRQEEIEDGKFQRRFE